MERGFVFAQRCEIVPLLLNLCLGPGGPLKEPSSGTPVLLRTQQTSSLEVAENKPSGKSKKKSSQKKKGAKLESGMAAVQIFSSGCLRMLVVEEDVQKEIMNHGGVRYLAPLLSSKLQQARWNARHVRFR